VKEETLQYDENTVGEMSKALTNFVAMTFGLQEPSSEDQLAAAATQPYLEGLYFIRRDIHSFDEAIPKFQQAAQLDPNSALPPAGMALALLQKYRATDNKAYLTKSQEFVNIAQSRNPDSARVLLAAARIKVQAKQYRRALEDYERILKLQPHNADALIGIGSVYEDLGQAQDAIVAYRRAQELDPDYYRSYQALGECLGNLSRYGEAAEEFRKAIARAPGFYDAYSSLGAMLIATKRYEEAEQVLNKSISIRETPMALNNLGALLSREGRFEEAATLQKRVLANAPANYMWLANVADNVRWAGHSADALPYYRRGLNATLAAITSEPHEAWPRALFAYFSARLGDETRAEQEIKEAVNLAPDDTDVLVKAIVTYEVLGERDLGMEYLKGMSSEGLQEASQSPDLADFCQDPRFQEEVRKKGAK
jgi:eukaryotic-like serine/threonine-protein kinase